MSEHRDIFEAIIYGTVEDVKYFVEQEGVNVNYRDSGMFPLLIAAGSNNIEAAKYLISKGADINMASSATGLTPLQLAKEKGHTEMVNFLSEQKSKLSPMKIVRIVLIVAGIFILIWACSSC